MRKSVAAIPMMVHIMLAAVFVTFLLFNPRPVSETVSGADAVRVLRGAVLLGVLGLAIVVTFLADDLGWIRAIFRPPLRWYALYALWPLASLTYTGNLFLSAAKTFELWVGLIVVTLAFRWVRPGRGLDSLWRACMAGLGGIVVGYFVVTAAAGLPMFTKVNEIPKYVGFGGGPGGANGMTQIGSILAIFGISRVLYRGRLANTVYLGVTAAALLIMLTSYSRASILIFAALVMILFVRSRRYIVAVMALGFGLLAVLGAGPSLLDFLLRGQDMQAFMSLTGRRDFLWVGGWKVFTESPWIGHGYYYATTHLLPIHLFGGFDARITNVDNTFLEVAMNLGVVGLALFAAVWISAGAEIVGLLRTHPEAWDIPMVRESVLLVVATFVRSWVNPTIAYHHWNTIVFLVAIVIIFRVREEMNVQKRQLPAASPAGRLGGVG